MSESIDLNPVARITADAVGEPGRRTFYLQARRDETLVTLAVEKGQVQALARHIEALIARVRETHPDVPEPKEEAGDLTLEEPIEPWFRVGSMALGYDADRDLVLLQCQEVTAASDEDDEEDDEEEEEEEEETGTTARFWATRSQMLALAKHGTEVAASGRPLCRLCGGPIDPDGHLCPASNGHRKTNPF